MKILLIAFLSALSWSCATGKSNSMQTPEKLWSKGDQNLSNPESAYYYSGNHYIYVSNVAGKPTDKDGKGWIDVYDYKGKLKKAKWAKGLNAPKGMRVEGKTLWVSDIDAVVGLDRKTGKLKKRISISHKRCSLYVAQLKTKKLN